MAKVNIKIFRPKIIGGVTAIYGPDAVDPEGFTSSGTSQVTTGAAPDGQCLVRITSSGGDVWITMGESPVAVALEGTLIIDGIPEVFEIQEGHKVALIDV